MYHCLNIVTEAEGSPSAVLIRGLQLLTPVTTVLNGPGKVCRLLGIDKTHNGLNLLEDATFYLKAGVAPHQFTATPRIGIRTGLDKLWRFVIKI